MLKRENLLKIIRFGAYLAMLTPLIYIPQTLFGAIFGKMIFFQIAVELALPFFLYLIISEKNLRPKFSGLTKVILIFFAALFLSSLLGIDWQKSFWGTEERMRGLWALLHFLLLYFYVITAFKDAKDRKRLIAVAIFVGLAVAAYGLLEEVNPNWSIDKVSVKSAAGSHRIISTAGNPIFLAGYMIFIFFLSLYYLLLYKDWSRWLGLAGIIFSLPVILYTGTRGAFLGVLIGLAVFLAFLSFLLKRKYRIAAAIGAAAILFVLFLLFFTNLSVLNNKYFDISRISSFSLESADGSIRGRLLLWRVSWDAFRENPVLGWGMENYDYAFDKYYNPQFYRGGINETWSDRAHNWFFDFLVMGGAVGLAAYLAIFAWLIFNVLKKKNRNRENFVLAGLLAAFAVHSFFEVDDPSTTLMFFFILAIFNSTLNDEDGIAPDPKPAKAVWIIIFMFPVLLSAYFFNIKPLYGGIDFINYKRASDLQQKQDFALKFLASKTPYLDDLRFRFATQAFLDAVNIGEDNDYVRWSLDKSAEEMKTVLMRHPGDYSYFHTLGNIYLMQGSLQKNKEILNQSIEIYKKALEISPKRQATIFQLSTAYLFNRQGGEAILALQKAVSYDNKVGQSHWRLAVALLADGRQDEAYKEFKDSIAFGFFYKIDHELFQAAGLCVERKDYDCVISLYKEITDRHPDNAEYLAQLAAAYAAAGRFEDAKWAVDKAVSLDPSLEAEAKIFLRQIGY